MTTTLHLLNSEPDDRTATLIDVCSDEDDTTVVVSLYRDRISGAEIDWSRLARDLFAHERVICWW